MKYCFIYANLRQAPPRGHIRHPGLLSQPPSFLFIMYKSGCQHLPENKCPFVLWPHASPVFCPRPACLPSCTQLAKRMLAAVKCSCGAPCTQPTRHPLPRTVPAQGLGRPRMCSFCPLTQLASPRVTASQPNKQAFQPRRVHPGPDLFFFLPFLFFYYY